MRSIHLAALFLVLILAGAAPAADHALPPAAIETEGVPPVPAELAERLARYQAVRSARFLDWDPAGEGMLILSQLGPLHQLYLVARPGATPRPLTAGDEPVSGGRFLPDGAILFSRGQGGDENFQIFELDPPGGSEKLPAERLLTDGRSRNLLMRPSPDGKRVAFSSTRRNGRDADLYILDREKRSPAELLFPVEKETWELADWLEAPGQAVLVRMISENESYGAVLDFASRKIEPCAAEMPSLGGSQGLQKVSRTDFKAGGGGKSLFFLTNARGEFREPARLDRATGRVTWLAEGLGWDAEDLTLSPDRTRAAFTLNADGLSEVDLLEDLDSPAPRRRKLPLAGGVVSDLRFSPDGKRLGFTFARGAEPGEAFALDLETGAVARWTESPRAGFGEAEFIRPRLIHSPSFDGRSIPAWIYLPPAEPGRSAGRTPVIISIHGGPESQSRPGFSDVYQFYLRELGAAVIAPNVRGSSGYGKSYSLLDNGRLREDSVKDIGALLDWIGSAAGGGALGLDPGRVAVTGGSYGGFMVLASLVRFGERLRAGVDSVGISDFITFLERTSPYRQDLRRAEYGDERDPAMRKFFEEISPAGRIGALRSALLLVHGKNDPRVPFSETVQVVEKARATGQPVWTLYARNEGHGFTRRENRDFQQAVTAEFLRRHLVSSPPVSIDPEREAALKAYQRAVELDDRLPGVRHQRANLLFRLEKFPEALADYATSIAEGRGPHDADSCWERGLAWYYAGDFEAGRKQFEGYHHADSLDIENGLWRFLCIAERDGMPRAVETILAYPRKVRPPFPALLDLYAGNGSPETVLAQASEGRPDSPDQNERLFYAHYYIAKHFEARRRNAEALQHLEKALLHRLDHFMYDCARIDRNRLKKAAGDH